MGGDSRRLYNYKEIAKKYLELQNQTKTAEYFNCDCYTVRKACKENNIEIKTSQNISKEKVSKKNAQLDKNTLEVIAIYNSISDAFRALNKTKSGGISKACNNGNVYIGYKWKWM